MCYDRLEVLCEGTSALCGQDEMAAQGFFFMMSALR